MKISITSNNETELDDFPLVSVITVTHNLVTEERVPFFRQCVESIHNQSYPNIEHIVMDGASNDGSLEIIREYEEKGWLKCYSQPDTGIDNAYNHALTHVTGKYVLFMNDDDKYYSDDVIKESLKKIVEQDADYSYGDEDRFDRNGNFVGHWTPTPERFWFTMPFSHQTMCIRTDVIRTLGGFDEKCLYGGDISLVFSLILNDFKGVYVDKTISYYRMGGISSRTDKMDQCMRTVYVKAQKMFDFSKQFFPSISFNNCVDIVMHLGAKGRKVFPQYYIESLVKYMVDKKLTNFDYNKFISCAHDHLVFQYYQDQEMAFTPPRTF